MSSTSQRKLNEKLLNFVLFAIVILSWSYVIIAGTEVSKRYLQRVDLSQYSRDEKVPEFFEL